MAVLRLFRVSGTDASGAPFSARLEAESAAAITAFCAREGVAPTAIRPLPLTAWPLARINWMILTWPFLGYLLFGALVLLGRGVFELLQGRRDVAGVGLGPLAGLAAAAAALAWMVWNILLRTGWRLDHQGEAGVREYARSPEGAIRLRSDQAESVET